MHADQFYPTCVVCRDIDNTVKYDITIGTSTE